MPVLWLSSAVLTGRASAAACEQVTEVQAYRVQIEAAWSAIRADHPARAHELVVELERSVACLDGPLQPVDAAALHRVKALDASYAGDSAGAHGAVSAAARLDPDGAIEWAGLWPAFDQLLGEAAPAGLREEFGTSLAARVYVDGEATPARSVGQPAVVQTFTPEGASIDGAWVAGRDPLPDWVVFPPFECAQSEAIDALLAEASRAERAYSELDVPTFEAALQAVGAGLPCLSGRIGTAQAAALHRLEGIRQFTHGAETVALRSFQEAQALDPAFQPPDALVRPGSTLADLWDRAALAAPSPWSPEVVPAPLSMAVDGLTSTVRPAALPSIIQLTAPGGRVLWTRYVPPGATLPSLTPFVAAAVAHQANLRPPALQVYREIGQRRETLVRRSGIAVGGIALLTASSALYVLNSNAVSEYNDPETLPARLENLRQTANLSATGSSVMFMAGTGLVIGALLR